MSKITTSDPKFEVEKTFPFLKGRGKTATRLHPRRNPNINPLKSKIGGAIAWPKDEPIPSCPRGIQAVPFVQIHSKDIPNLVFPAGTNLLQIIWFPDEESLYSSANRWFTYWRDAATLSDRELLLPKENTISELSVQIQECSINPEVIVEYPPTVLLTKRERELIYDWETAQDYALYQSSMSVCPGVKFGGYPKGEGLGISGEFLPKDSRGAMRELLLMFSAYEFGGGWYPSDIAGMTNDEIREAESPLDYDFPDPFNLFVDRSEDPYELTGIY